MINKIIPISKKARKKLQLARYPALPAWGETKPVFNKATQPLRVSKGTGEKLGLGPRDPERRQGQALT
jgi:hypothetical protein